MRALKDRVGWIVAGVLALFVAGAVAGVVSGGPLDPTAVPGSTMKTLEEIPGSWSRKLSYHDGCSSNRFQCVLNDEAVLDRETGLVWQRNTSMNSAGQAWAASVTQCLDKLIGGRSGWRLPSASELMSIRQELDESLHPFTLSFPRYWTSTTDPGNVANAFAWSPTIGGLFPFAKTEVVSTRSVWCVRGAGSDWQ